MFGRKRVKPIEAKSLDDLKPLLAEGKPVLLDFMQVNCRSCRIMDGIVNELAEEYAGSAYVVKVDLARVPAATAAFSIKATPTFVLLGRPAAPAAKKKAARRVESPAGGTDRGPVARWRASGLVRKDQLTRALEGAGAVRAE
ncbi:MAG: thioredoxin family protein [Actinobacteria bacterium]|nr:thioredoxin family protein [Actinomycetota bacterium]